MHVLSPMFKMILMELVTPSLRLTLSMAAGLLTGLTIVILILSVPLQHSQNDTRYTNIY